MFGASTSMPTPASTAAAIAGSGYRRIPITLPACAAHSANAAAYPAGEDGPPGVTATNEANAANSPPATPTSKRRASVVSGCLCTL